jgi:hypothetical protein
VRLKSNTMKRFGKEVGSVCNTGSVINNKKLGFNVRTNEMVTDIYVFCFAVIGIVD